MKLLNHVWLFATPWTIAHQVPPSMGFSRQEYWSGLPFPSPRESSRPRDQTQVSSITGRRFNLWATREAKFEFLKRGTYRKKKKKKRGTYRKCQSITLVWAFLDLTDIYWAPALPQVIFHVPGTHQQTSKTHDHGRHILERGKRENIISNKKLNYMVSWKVKGLW